MTRSIRLLWSFLRTRDTHTYCRAFAVELSLPVLRLRFVAAGIRTPSLPLEPTALRHRRGSWICRTQQFRLSSATLQRGDGTIGHSLHLASGRLGGVRIPVAKDLKMALYTNGSTLFEPTSYMAILNILLNCLYPNDLSYISVP